jgi:hypothetical protein
MAFIVTTTAASLALGSACRYVVRIVVRHQKQHRLCLNIDELPLAVVRVCHAVLFGEVVELVNDALVQRLIALPPYAHVPPNQSTAPLLDARRTDKVSIESLDGPPTTTRPGHAPLHAASYLELDGPPTQGQLVFIDR